MQQTLIFKRLVITELTVLLAPLRYHFSYPPTHTHRLGASRQSHRIWGRELPLSLNSWSSNHMGLSGGYRKG